jgi:hypothetical protein
VKDSYLAFTMLPKGKASSVYLQKQSKSLASSSSHCNIHLLTSVYGYAPTEAGCGHIAGITCPLEALTKRVDVVVVKYAMQSEHFSLR